MNLIAGDSLDLIGSFDQRPDLVVTDPPYALRGEGDEHAITATVAIVLREAATKLNKGGWMLVMCASSWRSQAYMAESVRGILEPIRTMTWCKPVARSKAKTSGPAFASVQVLVFKKGKSLVPPHGQLDHITAPPVLNGRRAELPPEVADWMVRPYATPGGLLLDPFAGSGAILLAAERAGMQSVGFEKKPPDGWPSVCPVCSETEAHTGTCSGAGSGVGALCGLGLTTAGRRTAQPGAPEKDEQKEVLT